MLEAQTPEEPCSPPAVTIVCTWELNSNLPLKVCRIERLVLLKLHEFLSECLQDAINEQLSMPLESIVDLCV